MNIPDPLSHAYLISGGREENRHAYGMKLAAAYLCESSHPPCGACRPCRKAASGAHPDLNVVSPPEGKREIAVDQIRQLRADAYIRPNEGRRKVYLIEPAEKLNPSAQNALLKVLEDGPEYTAFLLVTGEPGLMLETVRSRCEHLVLPPEEEPVDPQLLQKAEDLAELLLTGSELAVAERMAGLEQEKYKSEALMELLGQTARCVSRQLTRDPRRAAQILNAIKECMGNSVYNPNPGLMLGWLAAELFR